MPTPSIGGRTLLVQLGEVFFDKTLAQSPSAAPAPFSFLFSLVIVNVIHFLYQLEVNEVSMDRLGFLSS